jgi:hypothetical protein
MCWQCDERIQLIAEKLLYMLVHTRARAGLNGKFKE